MDAPCSAPWATGRARVSDGAFCSPDRRPSRDPSAAGNRNHEQPDPELGSAMSTITQEHAARLPTGSPSRWECRHATLPGLLPYLGAAALATMAGRAIALASTEATMGHAQRVLYVHVAVAWLALVGFLAVALSGLLYLCSRELRYDRWAHATAEVGWLCACLTLATGSLWAHAAWGTWWTWDPRLVSSFILWSLYGGLLLTRSSLEGAHTRARVVAILAVVGALDVPLVVMATRWFRAMHPVAPSLEPSMRIALACSVLACTAFAWLLVRCRRGQLELHDRLLGLEAAEPE